MEINSNKFSIAKWIILGILVYLNIATAVSSLNNTIHIILAYFNGSHSLFLVSTVFFLLLRYGVLVYLFVFLVTKPYLLNNTNLKTSLKVNLILFPILYVINSAMSLTQTLIITRVFNPELYGLITMAEQYIYMSDNFLSTAMLFAFGLIAYKRNSRTI